MKTAEEILEHYLGEKKYYPSQNWELYKNAMKSYASQAIDRYSEIHKQLTEAASSERSKDSIYSAANHFVKSELK